VNEWLWAANRHRTQAVGSKICSVPSDSRPSPCSSRNSGTRAATSTRRAIADEQALLAAGSHLLRPSHRAHKPRRSGWAEAASLITNSPSSRRTRAQARRSIAAPHRMWSSTVRGGLRPVAYEFLMVGDEVRRAGSDRTGRRSRLIQRGAVHGVDLPGATPASEEACSSPLSLPRSASKAPGSRLAAELRGLSPRLMASMDVRRAALDPVRPTAHQRRRIAPSARRSSKAG
jgi:hypothetical protein